MGGKTNKNCLQKEDHWKMLKDLVIWIENLQKAKDSYTTAIGCSNRSVEMVFNQTKTLLTTINVATEIKKQFLKSYVCNIAVYG